MAHRCMRGAANSLDWLMIRFRPLMKLKGQSSPAATSPNLEMGDPWALGDAGRPFNVDEAVESRHGAPWETRHLTASASRIQVEFTTSSGGNDYRWVRQESIFACRV